MDFHLPSPWIIAGGWLIGFLIGMTGVGAGSLTTPMLISGFGLPPAVAVGTDLLFASITKATAAWRHQRLANIDWTILRWLAAGSLPGAAALLAWLYIVHPETEPLARTIRTALGYSLFVSAAANALYPWLARHDVLAAFDLRNTGYGRIATIALGAVLGSLVTLTSVGAGAIGVVVLTILYPALLARRLIGTDIVHAIPLTLLAGIGHLHGVGGFHGTGVLAGRLDPRHRHRLSRHRHRPRLVAAACPCGRPRLRRRTPTEAMRRATARCWLESVAVIPSAFAESRMQAVVARVMERWTRPRCTLHLSPRTLRACCFHPEIRCRTRRIIDW